MLVLGGFYGHGRTVPSTLGGMTAESYTIGLSDRLKQLEQLEDGWHDEQKSLSVTSRALGVGRALIEVVDSKGLLIYLYPTVEGGLIFEWSVPRVSCSLEIEPHGAGFFLAVKRPEGIAIDQREIPAEDLAALAACFDTAGVASDEPTVAKPW